MIINTNQDPEAQYVGNIKANKVGIDTKNIDFIASLLTTNLYSNPIMSFIRETISNGWDSHIEAGVKQPVLVSLYSSVTGEEFRRNTAYSWGKKVPLEITIRDFGVGLSPDRFAAIYTNIGSSTKRDSNDFIGAFGIGRFSCLSCADSATLTSYYNGTKYSYLMYKDGASINIDELGQFSTTEDNGLAVKVSLQMDRNSMQELKEAFKALAYFNCIYINDPLNLCDGFSNDFNNRQIKEYTTFSIWDMPESYYSKQENVLLRVGNCTYPITKKQLFEVTGLPSNWPIAIKFNIGEIDVTPNREAILHNAKTDAAIKKKFQDVLEEVKAIFIKSINNLDFPSIIEWYKYSSASTHKLVLTVDTKACHHIELSIKSDLLQQWQLVGKACTINSIPIPSSKVFDLISDIVYISFPKEYVKFYYNVDTDKFYNSIPRYATLSCLRMADTHQVITTSDVKWKTILKDYVRQKIVIKKRQYGRYFLVLNRDKAKKFFWDIVKILLAKDTTPKKQLAKFIVNNLGLESIFKEINESSIPADYKEQWEKEKKANQVLVGASIKKPARTCVIHTIIDGNKWDYTIGGYQMVLNTEKFSLQDLQNTSRTVIYTTNNSVEVDMLKEWYYIYYRILNIDMLKPIFIAVAPSHIPTIAALPNAVCIDEFLNQRRPEIEMLASIDFEKLREWRSRHHSIDLDFSIHFPNFTARSKNYGKLCSSVQKIIDLTEFKFVSTVLENYRKSGWVDQEIIAFQNDEKIWAFFTFVSLIPLRDEDYATLRLCILGDYIQRIGLDTGSSKFRNIYNQSELYKHLID